jgi:hypothetical protein
VRSGGIRAGGMHGADKGGRGGSIPTPCRPSKTDTSVYPFCEKPLHVRWASGGGLGSPGYRVPSAASTRLGQESQAVDRETCLGQESQAVDRETWSHTRCHLVQIRVSSKSSIIKRQSHLV